MLATSLLLTYFLVPAVPTSIPAADKEMSALMDRAARYGWRGAALVTKKGKEVLSEAAFDADKEVTVDHLMEIASISKVFTAVAIMQLVEDDKVALDASISEYLPGVPDQHADILIRHLLSHTSGMRRSAGCSGSTLEEAIVSCLVSNKAHPPGKKEVYWNGGYALLAGVIEQVTGGTFEDYVRSHVFGPAGMTSACFVSEDPKGAPVATGYEVGQRTRTAVEHPYLTAGAWSYKGMGGVVCSAAELAKFGNAFMDGKLVSKKSVALMTEPITEYRGLGWAIVKDDDGVTRWSHGGDVRGFHGVLEILPEQKAVVVVLNNRSGPPQWALGAALRNMVLDQELSSQVPREGHAYKPKKWSKLEGEWQLEGTPEARFQIQAVDECVRLLPLSASGAKLLSLPSPESFVEDATVKAHEVLDAVIAGDGKKLVSWKSKLVPRSWYLRTLPDVVWPKHIEEHGELVEFTLQEISAPTADNFTAFFSLKHSDAAKHVKVAFVAGTLSGFDFKMKPAGNLCPPEPFLRLLPTSKKELASHHWSPFGDNVTITTGPKGDRLDMVLRGRSKETTYHLVRP